MALESLRVYRITSGDTSYQHSGNFGIEIAGTITIDDSNGTGDNALGDFTDTGVADVPDQNVTASTVTGIVAGNVVDSRYMYTFTGSDGSTGTVYFLATNSGTNYGSLILSTTPLDPSVTYTFGAFNRNGSVNYNAVVRCFARGTRIETETGPVRIEDLSVGDRVLTLDNGYQAIRWIGATKLGIGALLAKPKLRPVVIEKGALGCGAPREELRVSPQHRMLVRSIIARRMFDTDEVLVPANKLVGLAGIRIDDSCREVEYFHLLFDSHQIIHAEGALSESLLMGSEAVNGLDPEALAELVEIFGDLTLAGLPSAIPARPIPETGKSIKELVRRHQRNSKSLVAEQV
ncbi:Hint domain-containing protein [Paracoccus lutimaris]|uniref:Hint domain-containing protein n=1 Tax=Paracoccus lutimaris TaxID=1490030 RepID=A0A368YQ06_9RHOB|nr:Hint domain-containing protein [Paracoccus lutimaris]RCW81007.1 Hint domain-containing protein [Paracoccus lutimaris]